jgi:hypothetical protein
MTFSIGALALGLIGLPVVGFASGLSGELSRAQLAEVTGGGQVVMTEDVEGLPWPRIRAYRVVNATPAEVAAVFFDYENAKAFVPNVIKSQIATEHSLCTKDVDYAVDVPILPDETYTCRNVMTSDREGSFCIAWKLLRAKSTKSSEGSFQVEPFGDRTLMRYQNLVVPGSSFAGLLKHAAVDQLRATVEAIAREAERLRRDDPAKLAKKVAELDAALGKSATVRN